MKTSEEKAKAYDEAVNKIKPLYEQAKKDGNPIWSTYEYLIPELRESEDERIRKNLISFLEALYAKGKSAYDGEQWSKSDCADWIAYLEKQEHKPTWTEDDNDWVSNFERLLEFAYEHDPHGLGKICIAGKVWLNDRLKAFRPSWKPSEEQIESLIRATNRCVSPKDVEPLMSLYNDLKKL